MAPILESPYPTTWYLALMNWWINLILNLLTVFCGGVTLPVLFDKFHNLEINNDLQIKLVSPAAPQKQPVEWNIQAIWIQ